MATRYLFVYGTLRPGAEAPQAAELAAEGRCLGAADTTGVLLRVGRYPGLAGGDGRVTGEVYELRAPGRSLAWLDRYEGPEFRREVAPVRLKDGSELHAWIYRYVGETTGLRVIEGGDFIRGG